ncbi:hypothetical protein [Nostoc sp.]|uniref:hypothetical protein n=1 Tax=Nostoc sp. TaxID=1180 RepID=UPI002FF72929
MILVHIDRDWVWGIGHWALGIGYGALGIGHWLFSPLLPTPNHYKNKTNTSEKVIEEGRKQKGLLSWGFRPLLTWSH